MGDRHRFRPSVLERLEHRRVLSGSVTISPVPVAPPPVTTHSRSNPQSIVGEINQAFDSFTSDYLQAEGAFVAAGNTAVFATYTNQRVALLAQNLTRILSRLPGSLTKLSATERGKTGGSSVVLQAFLRSHINGRGPNTLLSVLHSLATTSPGQGPNATLYTLTATTAIETARAATITATKFLVDHNFNNGHGQ